MPIGFFWDYFHEWIMSAVVKENKSIENYTFSIYIISVCCAYFEFFYSWTKVHLNTVFGNVLKELWNRAVVTILLVSVYCAWISKIEFIYYLTGAYILRTFVMMFYAFKVYIPKFHFKFPDKYDSWERYHRTSSFLYSCCFHGFFY